MAELTKSEQEIIKAMEGLGANKDSSMKGANEISRKANRPRGLVANVLSSLVRKNMAKRAVKGKAAGYYLSK